MRKPNISKAFLAFSQEAPDHARVWGETVQGLAEANKLDEKTTSLVYIGILAALGLESGVPFHVAAAKNAGATRDEVISAILVGLTPAGHKVTQVLPAALDSYDQD